MVVRHETCSPAKRFVLPAQSNLCSHNYTKRWNTVHVQVGSSHWTMQILINNFAKVKTLNDRPHGLFCMRQLSSCRTLTQACSQARRNVSPGYISSKFENWNGLVTFRRLFKLLAVPYIWYVCFLITVYHLTIGTALALVLNESLHSDLYPSSWIGLAACLIVIDQYYETCCKPYTYIGS